MENVKRLVELEQKYELYLNDITELRFKLEEEESKLFKCQKEIRLIKQALPNY